ncbi:rCG20449 [Rattus norvegicus]|uniref:RCG20449 n=1 Tax=Rattus norvegicus TaxID=10116 RepID=A6JGD1_RAT|nr:rCG20449 [Rattus norvegicus]
MESLVRNVYESGDFWAGVSFELADAGRCGLLPLGAVQETPHAFASVLHSERPPL